MVRSLPVWLCAALLAAAVGCGQPKKLVPAVDAGTLPFPKEKSDDPPVAPRPPSARGEGVAVSLAGREERGGRTWTVVRRWSS